MYLSKNIKHLRKKAGMTTTDLADRLGVKQPTVSTYEQGSREPPLRTVLAICDVFQVNAHDLLTVDMTMNEEATDQLSVINDPEGEYQVKSDSEWGEHEIVAALKKIIHSLK